MSGGQSGFAQSTGETEPVHEAEAESHDPGSTRGDAFDPTPLAHNFRRNKDDAQSDDRLDRGRRNMNPAERCGSEGEAVRDGEGGDGLHQSPATTRDDEQREDKQQMVHTREDVLDTEDAVGAGDFPHIWRSLDRERRDRRREARDLRGAVEPLQEHEHIGHRRGKAGDMYRAAGQPSRALHGPALAEGVVDYQASWLGQVFAVGGKLHVEPQTQVVPAPGHLPEHVVSLRPGLAQFKIGRAHLVRGCAGREHAEKGNEMNRSFHGIMATFFSPAVGCSMVTV